MKQPKLPRKPSALIRLALDDLAKVERDEAYKVNMDTWHHPSVFGPTKCLVCFAGSVMAKTLEVPVHLSTAPGDFAESRAQLYALDSFRGGTVGIGLMQLGFPCSSRSKWKEETRRVPDYHANRRAFKLAMRKLARDFEAVGL